MCISNVDTKPTNLNGSVYVPRAAESPFTVTTQSTLLIYFAVGNFVKQQSVLHKQGIRKFLKPCFLQMTILKP